MTTGWRWFRIWGRRRSSERTFCGSWDMRGRMSGSPACFYKAAVQNVLLYGSDMWVLTPQMVRTLGDHHHRVVVGWRVWTHIEDPTGGGSTHPYKRLRRRKGWIQSRPTSLALRTRLPNILQLVQYWSCVWRRSGAQGNESQSSGWIRGAWAGRACGRRQGQQRLRVQRQKRREKTGRMTARQIRQKVTVVHITDRAGA